MHKDETNCPEFRSRAFSFPLVSIIAGSAREGRVAPSLSLGAAPLAMGFAGNTVLVMFQSGQGGTVGEGSVHAVHGGVGGGGEGGDKAIWKERACYLKPTPALYSNTCSSYKMSWQGQAERSRGRTGEERTEPNLQTQATKAE